MQEDSNYCVYLHKNSRTNEVFYVGSGRKNRAKYGNNRSAKWHAVVEADGFYPEIVYDNLSKEQSIAIELDLYTRLLATCPLVNVNKPINTKHCDKNTFKDLYYDETSPTCLRWKNTFYYPNKSGHTAHTVAGKHSGRATRVVIGKDTFSVHRVVWILHHGEIDSRMVIDHIDGDTSNNKIGNLRLISQKENTRNRKQLKNNKSGVPGVFFYNYKNSRNHWRSSHYDINGKYIHKYFSVDDYGYDNAFKLACEYRTEQIRLLNEQGAGYTERHGT